jgi:C_GCAxxG_C_C family probable redox protein
MEKSKQEISDRAFELAKRYERENGDCAQCVIASVFEALGIENGDVFRAATGFADGVGLTGDGHCGALSGGIMAISYFFGRKREEFFKRGKLIKALLLSRDLHGRFKEKYSTCRCHDLQIKFVGRFYNLLDPADFEAVAKTDLAEKCSTLTGDIARMAADIILEQQEEDAGTPA